MPSLKSLKNRVKSVKSTQKITKAMKMVAASKLKRARERAESSSVYATSIAEMMKTLSQGLDISMSSDLKLLFGNSEVNTTLLVVMTSDRGLCGAFNANVVKLTRAKVSELVALGRSVKIFCLGKKGYESLKKTHSSMIIGHLEGPGKTGITYDFSSAISENFINRFTKNEFGECLIIFSKFKSAIAQEPTSLSLIPLEKSDDECALSSGCEYEPSEEEIVKELLPKNFSVQIYRALLETSASEQGARMTAMDNATRNSGEMIKKLNLVYNRTRQAYITKELIEIISGAEAV